jgi:hypothetical protein
MISPNLLDIWPVFFLILSRYETVHFLIVFRPSGDGYSLLGSKNSLRGTALKIYFHLAFPGNLLKSSYCSWLLLLASGHFRQRLLASG